MWCVCARVRVRVCVCVCVKGGHAQQTYAMRIPSSSVCSTKMACPQPRAMPAYAHLELHLQPVLGALACSGGHDASVGHHQVQRQVAGVEGTAKGPHAVGDQVREQQALNAGQKDCWGDGN